MPTLDRYLLREFAQSVAATLVVLLFVSLGGLVADLLSEIARGKLPATLLFAQLGLRTVQFLPLILPLALFLGLLLAISRLYRDSEMAVLAAVGVGPRRLLRPLAWLALPVVLVVAVCSLWAAPAAQRSATLMIDAANRSLLVAGLEPGRFVELSNGVIYVDAMSADGTAFGHMFLQSEKDGRIDVTTAQTGELFLDDARGRYLLLKDGFRVEGPLVGRDFRMMRFEQNELQAPDRADTLAADDPLVRSSGTLLAIGDAASLAELHWRLGTPLLAAILALLALPLARSEPRQARYGPLMLAFLGYLVYMNLLVLGRSWLGAGAIPGVLGLWWLHAPALAIAGWMFAHDGQLRAPGRAALRAAR